MSNYEIFSILFKPKINSISKYINIIIFLFVIITPIFYSDNNINNLVIFDSQHYRAGNFAINSNGDMIVEYSNNSWRLFYGLKKNGRYYFNGTNNDETPMKEIKITNSENNDIYGRYESKNIFVSLEDDYNDNKQNLFSTSSFTSVTELYNIDNLEKNDYFIRTTSDILGHEIFSYSFSLLELPIETQKLYFLLITYTDGNPKGNAIDAIIFSFPEQNLNIQIKNRIRIDNNYNRVVSSYIMNSLIVLFYLNRTPNFVIRVYDFELEQKGSDSELGALDSSDYRTGDGHFFKSIHLKNNIGVFIYYKGQNKYNPVILIGDINENFLYTNKIIKEITEYNFQTNLLLNDLIKINDNRFSFITTSTDRTHLYILLFDLYNNDSNLKIRVYKPNLSNYIFVKELATVIYNNYLVFSSTVVDPNTYVSEDDDCFSIFMMFGYANGTDSIIDISNYFMDDNIKNGNNLISKLVENITFDNNIFGYEIDENHIKLISIPDEIIFYNIINGENSAKLSNGSILNSNYSFKQNNNLLKTYQLYSLEYQYITQEPDYDKFNVYPLKIINVSSSDSTQFIYQAEYYNKTIFYGRTNIVKFKLCHDYCGSCHKIGTSINDQKCESCLDDYQYDYPKISAPNCVPEKYYKNSANEIIPYTEGNPKYFTNLTSNKTIYFKNDLFCPDEYPFLIKNTNECKNSCTYQELLYKNCTFSQETDIIYNELKENVIKTYPADGESLVIEAEVGYVFQLTTTLNELKSLGGIYPNGYNLSMIDLNDCEALLKQTNGIDPETPLIILKYEKLSTSASDKNVQYEIYNPINKTKLDLSMCQSSSFSLYMSITLSDKTQNLYIDLSQSGYDLFNINDSFYTDICTPYKSENGTDVLLSDRIKDFYSVNETMCQANCQYSEYSFESQYLKCECKIENEDIDIEEPEKFSVKIIFTSFYEVIKYSNFKVLKCYKLVFNIQSITKNIGSIIVIILFLCYLCFFVFYTINGIKPLKINTVKTILKHNKNNNKCKENNQSSVKFNEGQINLTKNKRKKSNEKNKIKEPPRRDKKFNTEIKNNNKVLNTFVPRTKNKNITYKAYKNEKILTTLVGKSRKNSNIKPYKKDYPINHKDQTNASVRKMIDTPESNNKKLNQIEIYENKFDLSNRKLDDFELNDLDYLEAIELDKRPFSQMYWSILKREHSILFTFFSWNDYNISYIKFARFFFFICTDMAMNVFFFSDDSMHKVYLNYGKYNFIQQIPQIIYSTIFLNVVEVIICYLSLTDKHIYQIKAIKNHKNNKVLIFNILKCIKIKLIGFFAFTSVFFFFYWYTIACFCAVYQNTQIIFIKDCISSFLTSLTTPFIIYFLTSVLRLISLKDITKKRFKCIYKLSGILPIF